MKKNIIKGLRQEILKIKKDFDLITLDYCIRSVSSEKEVEGKKRLASQKIEDDIWKVIDDIDCLLELIEKGEK